MLAMLLGPSYGFRYIWWDGITPRALVDAKGRVFGALAGRPQGAADWDENVHQPACSTFEKAATTCNFEHHAGELPRRGPFPALDAGVSHGGGQLVRPQIYSSLFAIDLCFIASPNLYQQAP